jgi:hypothetical protein
MYVGDESNFDAIVFHMLGFFSAIQIPEQVSHHNFPPK